MKTCRNVWVIAVAVACLVGLGGTIVAVPLSLILWTGVALAVFGALMAFSFKEDLAGVRHPIVWGAGLAIAPALVPGLARVLGDATLPVVVLLVVASPWVVTLAERRLRPWRRTASIVRAGMAAPDEALRRQWEESTRQLDEASSIADRLVVVDVREQILDDVAARHGGQLPAFIWGQTSPRGGLDRRSDEPHRPR